MRRLYILLFLLLGNHAVAAQLTATQQLQTILNSYRSYQANFDQRTTSSQRQHITKRSQGRLYILKPGRFRWETDRPTQQIIIANGNVLWIYDKDLMQATRQTLKQQKQTDPASLLTGNVNQLGKLYRIELKKNRQ